MNILLWTLQILLGLHTGTGAVWKFSNTAEQTMPSLKAIPDIVWMAMSGIEILCAIGLILPIFMKRFAKSAPIAALFIVAEMLLFCGLHLMSGDTNSGPMVYWLIVAAVSGFIAYGRLKLRPI